MAWRLAKSLETLRTQINEAYPKRSKVSDGTIGDTAHANTVSDHNPNAQGVVTAFDLTHDPKNGVDIVEIAEQIRTDPRVKYLIRNRQILITANGQRWVNYTGINPHTSHLHISVKGNYDSTKKWNIKEDDMYKGKSAEFWYNEVKRRGGWLDKIGKVVGVNFLQKVSDITAEAKTVNAIVKAVENKSPSKAKVLTKGTYEVK